MGFETFNLCVTWGCLAAGYREQEMPGEVCPEVLPPPNMSNLGFLNTMPINGSEETLFPLGLRHCWGREVQTKSSAIDLVLVK